MKRRPPPDLHLPIVARLPDCDVQIGWVRRAQDGGWDAILEMPLRGLTEALELACDDDPVKQADRRIGLWQRVRWWMTRERRAA